MIKYLINQYRQHQINRRRVRWIEALESGEYPQCRGRLKKYQSGITYYCCLGVANEIFGWKSHTNHNYQVLTKKATDLLGLVSETGTSTDDKLSLAKLNDDGNTFQQIADELKTGSYWKENKIERKAASQNQSQL